MKDEPLCHQIFRFSHSCYQKKIKTVFPFCPYFFLHLLRSDKFMCYLNSFQVLINGLQHFVHVNVKPKLQMVETFIKVRPGIFYPTSSSKVYWRRNVLIVTLEACSLTNLPRFLNASLSQKCLGNIFIIKIINRCSHSINQYRLTIFQKLSMSTGLELTR